MSLGHLVALPHLLTQLQSDSSTVLLFTSVKVNWWTSVSVTAASLSLSLLQSFSQPSRYASLRDDSDSGEERDEEERPAALEGEEN